MITMNVKAQVPENRKIEITLPSLVPAGDAEIELRITTPAGVIEDEIIVGPDGRRRAFPMRPTDPKLAREHDLFEQMLPELMKLYIGKYVALHDGIVIEVGDSKTAVLTNSYKKCPNTLHYVRLVTDQPEPLDRVTSFRIIGESR